MNWGSNILWGIIGVVVTVIFGFIFYWKSLKRRQLSYNILTLTMLSDVADIEGLSVKYNDKPITKLFKSRITLTNTGNVIINPDDIAPLAPIAIKTDGDFIFDKTVKVNSSNKNNELHLLPIPNIQKNETYNNFQLHYDYIAKNEKIVFEVFHTGNIDIQGALKDGKFTKTTEKEFSKNQIRQIDRIFDRIFELIILRFLLPLLIVLMGFIIISKLFIVPTI